MMIPSNTSTILPWSTLAKLVYKDKYSRNDAGHKESWNETISRVIEGNYRVTAKYCKENGLEIDKIFPAEEKLSLDYFLRNRKATPAGRGLWFSGAPAHDKLGGIATCNCFYLNSVKIENFYIAADLLMCGGGVGLSVEHKYVSKLPKVKENVKIVYQNTRDADFIVPDSREGWCELLRRALEAYFYTGKSFSFSTVCIRNYGDPIKGFGGTSSGPAPLVQFIKNLNTILSSRAGKHVRPIDAADIICAIGQMVVSGNVRRSALIIIGDCFDKEYLKAKRWSLGNVPNYRSEANFSVTCSDVDDLHPLFWKTYEDGEPFGIVNVENIKKFGRIGEELFDNAEGVNPCLLDTAKILTKNGIKELKEIFIGDIIWSGTAWTKVTNKWKTGNKEVYRYTTSAGIFEGTYNHRILENGEKVEVGLAETIDISTGPQIKAGHNRQEILDGLVFGDGYCKNGFPVLIVGKDDYDILESFNDLIIRQYNSKNTYEVKTNVLPQELSVHLPERKIPERYFKSSNPRSFLRGLFSANGSALYLPEHRCYRVSYKTTCKELLLQIQMMLSSVGISSYITTNKPTNVTFSNGTYLCKESYDLNITGKENITIFYNNIGFEQKYKTERLEKILKDLPESSRKKTSYEIRSVESLGYHDVWDITVDCPEHVFWCGGLLVSNCGEATLAPYDVCNLQEICLSNLDDEQEFFTAARLMHRYGKRVTLDKYHIHEVQEIVKKNRRVGTGITGCLAAPKLFIPDVLDEAYRQIQEENIEYSKTLRIPQSIRTTVVKPSGTISKIMDANGYEGIHPVYSRYMIQRLRIPAISPLIPLLAKAGHKIEPQVKFDGTLDNKTLVVDFYVAAPENCPVADEDWDTWKQLDVVKLAQKHWADQSVSVTVYYKKEELDKIKVWLRDNLKYLKTISFLPHSDHGFLQAPKEKISRDQFYSFTKKLKPIEIDSLDTMDNINSDLECTSGVCPIK